MILAAATSDGDTSTYLRGKLRLAGITADTPLAELCDALVTLCVDGVPDMRKWRDQLDIASWKVRPPDRSSWGLRPDQILAQQALAGGTAP